MSAVYSEFTILGRTEVLIALSTRFALIAENCDKKISRLLEGRSSKKSEEDQSAEVQSKVALQKSTKASAERVLYLLNGMASGLELTQDEIDFFVNLATIYTTEASKNNKISMTAAYICNLLNTLDSFKTDVAKFYHLLAERVKSCEQELEGCRQEIALNKVTFTKSPFGSQEYERLKREEVQDTDLALQQNKEYLKFLTKYLSKLLKIIKNLYFFQKALTDKQKLFIQEFLTPLQSSYSTVKVATALQPKQLYAWIADFILRVNKTSSEVVQKASAMDTLPDAAPGPAAPAHTAPAHTAPGHAEPGLDEESEEPPLKKRKLGSS